MDGTGGVLYTSVQQIDLAVDAPDAWSHKDKVKDLSLVDVTGGTTGIGTVWLRPDTASFLVEFTLHMKLNYKII